MATFFAPNFSLLVGNTAGNVQSLPDERVGGKTRVWVEKVTLNGQAPGDFIAVARLPVGSVPIDIEFVASASLGAASTVAIGDKNNVSRFCAAGTFTTTDTKTSKINAAGAGVPITTAYQYDGTLATATGPVAYEDILLTLGVSSLPVGGTLTVITTYLDYGA